MRAAAMMGSSTITGVVRVVAVVLALAAATPASAAAEPKVLRLALTDIAYLDPQQITDLAAAMRSAKISQFLVGSVAAFEIVLSRSKRSPDFVAANARMPDACFRAEGSMPSASSVRANWCRALALSTETSG